MSFPITTRAPQPSGDWTALNPTLAQFEEGTESDTGKTKRGPGAWNDLSYYNPGGTVGAVSDTAYNATSWDAVTAIAPSKNAVRDKFVASDAAIALKLTAPTPATHIADPTAGSTVDSQSRTAIGLILDALEAAGIVAGA